MAIESAQDPAFVPRLIPLLTEMSLAEVLDQPFVRDLIPGLLERHHQALELIRERSTCEQGTIYFAMVSFMAGAAISTALSALS